MLAPQTNQYHITWGVSYNGIKETSNAPGILGDVKSAEVHYSTSYTVL